MRETDADCTQEGPTGYQYRNEKGGLGQAIKGYNKQTYQVTIYVQSPDFTCQVTGYSGQSIAAAHENAWYKIQAPMAERLNRP